MYNSPTSAGGTGTFNGSVIPAGLSGNGDAWEIGARANMWGFEAVGYYYSGNGVGTTAIGSQAQSFVCAVGNTVCSLASRDSSGYYGQITYKWQD